METLSQNSELHLLSPNDYKFYWTDGGFLGLKKQTKDEIIWERIHVYRAFPHEEKEAWLSVRDAESKEIGLVENLLQFPPEQAECIRKELSRRYFIPQIKKVLKVKEEFGYSYWSVETDLGERRFTLKSGQNSVVALGEARILMVDMDGNRYEISDFRSLDDRSRSYIEGAL